MGWSFVYSLLVSGVKLGNNLPEKNQHYAVPQHKTIPSAILFLFSSFNQCKHFILNKTLQLEALRKRCFNFPVLKAELTFCKGKKKTKVEIK